MVQFLFYRGHDKTPQAAIEKALVQCADILINNPTLVVQLESVEPTGNFWDADIRVMSLKNSSGDDFARKLAQKGVPALKLDMENPEHAVSGAAEGHRPSWMRPELPLAAYRFANAARAGEVPDIPIQEIKMSNYEFGAASEPELKRMLQILEDERRRLSAGLKPKAE